MPRGPVKVLEKYDHTNPDHVRFWQAVNKQRRVVKQLMNSGLPRLQLTRIDLDEAMTRAIWEVMWPYRTHVPLDDEIQVLKLLRWATTKQLRNVALRNRLHQSRFYSGGFRYDAEPESEWRWEDLQIIRELAVRTAVSKLMPTEQVIARRVLAEGEPMKTVSIELKIAYPKFIKRVEVVKRKLRALLADFAR